MNTTPISLGHFQSKNKKKVIIVHNDEAIQRVLQGALEDAGFDTRTMWSGYEALAFLESQPSHVLLADDYVPDLHFHDFLKRVGRLRIQPRIVVMQTPRPTEDDLRQYALLGASAVVSKHDIDQVCRVVSSCCIDDSLAKIRVN